MSADQRWTPSVTVAAVIEHDGRYLMVEEHTPEGLRLNQPAGHLEPGESPIEACRREVLEETARPFAPQAFLGVYLGRFERAGRAISYLRLAFVGSVDDELPGRGYDREIVRTLWLAPQQIDERRAAWRSPLVGLCLADALAGRRLPLAAVVTDASVHAAAGARP